MTLNNPTRRTFLKRLAAVSGAPLLSTNPRKRMPAIEYQAGADCIEVFRQQDERRWKVQRVASANPSFLALDTARNRLFAVNEIDEYEGMPMGSVESYAVAPDSGRIDLIGRQPLALSAIFPKHLAISPDGASLVVAVYGGGAYNVLPVRSDGKIGSVTQVLKEIGSGPHPIKQATAHPHSVAFHPSGKFVIATDFGADRISVFSFEGGLLSRIQQVDTPPGSGPAGLHISPSGQQVLVEYRLQTLRSCYQFDASKHPKSIYGTRLTPLSL